MLCNFICVIQFGFNSYLHLYHITLFEGNNKNTKHTNLQAVLSYCLLEAYFPVLWHLLLLRIAYWTHCREECHHFFSHLLFQDVEGLQVGFLGQFSASLQSLPDASQWSQNLLQNKITCEETKLIQLTNSIHNADNNWELQFHFTYLFNYDIVS